MKGSYKQFDKELFDENNDKAIAAVLEHINKLGLYAHVSDDLYGPDVEVFSGFRKTHYVEVEVKRVWKGTKFPWDTIQLPERKAKFLRKRLPIEFWILNSTMDHVVIIPDYAVSSSPLVEVQNSLISEGEKFFQIPIDQCIIKEL
jgi:hypothetical protein